MSDELIRVLLVEDSPTDGALLREALGGEPGGAAFAITTVPRLAEALAELSADEFDVALVDLGLPDNQGLDTFTALHQLHPTLPIIVLSELADEKLAVNTMQAGAQDYLVKGETDSNPVARSIRYAIERRRLVARLESQSVTDELTGLYNRRGFSTLAEQAIRLARRTGQGFWLLGMDLDDFKQVNDQYGHQAGDMALAAVARVLRKTLRESDVVARMGGDEFVALAMTAIGDGADSLVARLQDNVRDMRPLDGMTYRMGISVGLARFDPATDMTLDDLLRQADQGLYGHKRTRR
jgi:diguanylate cyclase (GGDEF)-like protein